MNASQPLFYKKVVPLNKEQHKSLFIEPVEGYAFSKNTNSLYIAAIEFPRAASEYPIVFGKDNDGTVFPVVLLGLKTSQNLYVDKTGKWQATYIPAYARRYPFILANPGNETAGKFTVCIDEGYKGFNTSKKGQRLFDGKGNETAILKQAVDFLRDYQTHIELTTAFCKNLVALDLLEPMQANVKMQSGENYSIGGFQCVSREKLKKLPADKLAGLIQTDQMELIYAHLLSLNNVSVLMNRLN